MTTDKDAMEKAAKKSAKTRLGFRDYTDPDLYHQFITGWKAAHQGPKVLALVDCLKRLSTCEIDTSTDGGQEIVRKIIAEFEGMKK